MIATNLTLICCVFKVKTVKNDLRLILKNVASIQIKKVAIYDSYLKMINLISNRSFRCHNLKSSIIFRHLFFRYGISATCNFIQSIESWDIWRPTILSFKCTIIKTNIKYYHINWPLPSEMHTPHTSISAAPLWKIIVYLFLKIRAYRSGYFTKELNF